jgi:hypothetical protein
MPTRKLKEESRPREMQLGWRNQAPFAGIPSLSTLHFLLSPALFAFGESGRQDLNLRPLAPQADLRPPRKLAFSPGNTAILACSSVIASRCKRLPPFPQNNRIAENKTVVYGFIPGRPQTKQTLRLRLVRRCELQRQLAINCAVSAIS